MIFKTVNVNYIVLTFNPKQKKVKKTHIFCPDPWLTSDHLYCKTEGFNIPCVPGACFSLPAPLSEDVPSPPSSKRWCWHYQK